MRIQLLTIWESLRGSFWFVPSAMVGAAVALAMVMPQVDDALDLSSREGYRWLKTTTPAARQTLSSLAGATITAASVVFSLTMVVLSITVSQFGPRLLRTFINDRTTQVALGAFLSSSAYCLLVLRNIHSEDDYLKGYELPSVSVLLGVLLSMGSVGVLIYFIHHIAIEIQAERVIRSVAHDLDEAIDRVFPEGVGTAPDAGEKQSDVGRLAPESDGGFTAVPALHAGYITVVEDGPLLSVGRELDAVLTLRLRPGDFVTPGMTLLEVRPPCELDDGLTRRLNDAFALGVRRTPAQDVEAAINELVEVAVRALSPGINDPFTAVACIDYLSASLCRLLRRRLPGPHRLDDQGQLRVIARPQAVVSAIDAAFDQIRQYGRTSVAVTIRLMDGLGRMAMCVCRDEDAAALRRQAEMIERGAAEEITEKNDLADVRERFRLVIERLEKRHADSVRSRSGSARPDGQSASSSGSSSTLTT